MAATLFFYEILRLFLEGYIEFVVSCWLNFFAPDRAAVGTVFGFIFAIIILIICWLILPAISIYTLLPKHRENLIRKKYKKRIGALYAE